MYSETWELGAPKGLRKTVLNSEVVLFLRHISTYCIRLGTEVAVFNSQGVTISQVVLKTGFTVVSKFRFWIILHVFETSFRICMLFETDLLFELQLKRRAIVTCLSCIFRHCQIAYGQGFPLQYCFFILCGLYILPLLNTFLFGPRFKIEVLEEGRSTDYKNSNCFRRDYT